LFRRPGFLAVHGNRLALSLQHLNLAQLRNDLLRTQSFPGHHPSPSTLILSYRLVQEKPVKPLGRIRNGAALLVLLARFELFQLVGIRTKSRNQSGRLKLRKQLSKLICHRILLANCYSPFAMG
jgi:hypothetical protein